jgi:hypothetical protein
MEPGRAGPILSRSPREGSIRPGIAPNARPLIPNLHAVAGRPELRVRVAHAISPATPPAIPPVPPRRRSGNRLRPQHESARRPDLDRDPPAAGLAIRSIPNPGGDAPAARDVRRRVDQNARRSDGWNGQRADDPDGADQRNGAEANARHGGTVHTTARVVRSGPMGGDEGGNPTASRRRTTPSNRRRGRQPARQGAPRSGRGLSSSPR